MDEPPESIFSALAADLIDILQLWSLGPNSKPPFVSVGKTADPWPDPSRDGRLDAVVECITAWFGDHAACAKPAEATRRLAQRVIAKLEALDAQPDGMPAETIRRQCIADLLQAELQG